MQKWAFKIGIKAWIVIMILVYVTLECPATFLLIMVFYQPETVPLYRIAFLIYVGAGMLTKILLAVAWLKLLTPPPPVSHPSFLRPVSYTKFQAAIRAFMAPSFPVNPIPFTRVLETGVRQNGTDWIKTDEAKAVLLTVLSMSYGQLFTLDSSEESARLKRLFDSPK